MISLEEIQKDYPPHLHKYKREILREYLQYKMLKIVANSKYSTKLSFLGGTALRVIYGSSRFSEDLDFDNFGLTREEFGDLAQIVASELTKEGLESEVGIAGVDAYRCNVKFPDILFANRVSPLKNEKILIQVDSLSQGFPYKPDLKLMTKFGVSADVPTTPLDILLAQKIYTSFNRPRIKGRDFFDIIFLCGFTKPNYSYLKLKIGVDNPKDLKAYYLDKIKDFNFEKISLDVKELIFVRGDIKQVVNFPQFIENVDLG